MKEFRKVTDDMFGFILLTPMPFDKFLCPADGRWEFDNGDCYWGGEFDIIWEGWDGIWKIWYDDMRSIFGNMFLV